MKRSFALLAYVALVASSALAQAGNSSRADGFRGLILNQTTAEDAIRMLGQPAQDKVDRLDVSRMNKWLDPKHNERIFRQLTFRNVGDFSQIELSFLENKLMVIELDFKKILSPLRIQNLFAVEFAVVGVQSGPSDLPDKPGKYPVRFLPDYYPFRYNVVGISDKAFIWVDCSTGESRDPGRVDRTRQISRALEKK
jgi:hypothetical protein